jgi:hypothetical protein
MADNVGYTPGSGVKVTSRDVTYSGETAQIQVVGLATLTGADDAKVVTDVAESNPLPVAGYGELIEALEAQRFALQALTRMVGQGMPDVAGRLRVAIDAISASLTLATITTVTTCSTLTNQTQVGGLAATEQIPSLMRVAADSLRRNISVT